METPLKYCLIDVETALALRDLVKALGLKVHEDGLKFYHPDHPNVRVEPHRASGPDAKKPQSAHFETCYDSPAGA